MNDPTILIVPPQNLSAKDKRDLAKAGVIVLEMEDPTQARLIRAHAELSSTDLLGAAAEAISKDANSASRQLFAKAVCGLLENAAARNRPTPTDATVKANEVERG